MPCITVRRRGAAIAVAALALVAAACGDSDTDETATTAASDTTLAPSTTSPPTTAAPSTTGTDDTDAMDDGDGSAGHDHDEDHSHGDAEPVEAPEGAGVTVEVLADPMSGWNLHAVPTGMTLAPEHVSTDHVDGEGHMHLYIDGEKITRLYGEWYHLGVLEPGTHEIRVELSANDHSPLAVDGVIVDDTVTIEVPDDSSDPGDMDGSGDGAEDPGHEDHADDTGDADDTGGIGDERDGPVIELTVGGEVARHTVAVGDDVMVVITGDEPDEVHLHGYDLEADVAPGAPATISFTADIPGVFEIELHDAGALLAELEVQ